MTLDALCKVRNPFEGRDAQADEERTPVTSSDPVVEMLVALHGEQPPKHGGVFQGNAHEVYTFALKNVPAVPTPVQIQHVVARLDREEWVGPFANALIQKSFDAGHNGFYLTLPDPRLFVGAHLQGTRRRPLNLRVEGDVSMFAQHSSKYCDMEITGDAGTHCSMYAENCVMRASSVQDIGSSSSGCHFYLNDFSLLWGHRNTYYVPGSLVPVAREQLGLTTVRGWLKNLIERNKVEVLK